MLRAGIFITAITCASLCMAEDASFNSRLLEVRGTMESINGELNSQHADLSKIKSDLNALSRENTRYNRQLLDEIKALRRQNQALIDTNQALINAQVSVDHNAKNTTVMMNASRNYDVETPDGKMLFGGEEYVYVKEANATFAARVDTGATVSSITATNITRFESDGIKMVRFTIEANGRKIEAQAPFLRVTRVRQSSSSGFSYRVVVGLNVKIGDYSVYSEFNLMDRTSMDFPMLLGRSLITDIAAVDVSRNYIQKRADPDGLLLINHDLFTLLQKNGKDPNAEYDARQAKEASGGIAMPDLEHGARLGTDSNNALPEVSQQNLKDEYVKRLTDSGVSLPNDLKAEQDATNADKNKALNSDKSVADKENADKAGVKKASSSDGKKAQ